MARVCQVIRAGLYSKNVDVVTVACRTFTKLSILLNENPQNPRLLDLYHAFYEWLTMKQVIKQPTQDKKSPQKKKDSVSTFS